MYDLLELELVGGLWFAVYMGDKVEDRLVVAHDEANGRWEL
jgi:hypothetical protein